MIHPRVHKLRALVVGIDLDTGRVDAFTIRPVCGRGDPLTPLVTGLTYAVGQRIPMWLAGGSWSWS